MVAEVFAGIGALKTAFDIAKGLKDIDDTARRNAAVIELQEKILSAQSAQSDLVERVRELEKEVAAFETWDADKKRYELKDIGLGSLAYVVKESERGAEPPHQICAACYQHRKVSILQPKSESRDKLLICPECKTKIKIGNLPLRGVMV
jgi:hypothetical protein